MKKMIFALSLLSAFSGQVFAHGGGVDEHGCHEKKGVRHCHGENVGKYIPMNEEKRLEKLHRDNCNSITADGDKVRHDVYGKKCYAKDRK